MFSERVERTIHLETDLTRDEVLQSLNQCGNIRGVYPAEGTGDPARSQYFVEFREAITSMNVDELPAALRDSHSCALSAPSHLVNRFRAVAGPNLPPKPQIGVLGNIRFSPYQSSRTARAERSSKEKRRPPTYTTLEATSSTVPSPYLHSNRTHPHSERIMNKENRSLPPNSSQQVDGESRRTKDVAYVDREAEGWPHPSPVLIDAAPLPPFSKYRQSTVVPTPFTRSNMSESSTPTDDGPFSIRLSEPDQSLEQIIISLRAAACHPSEYGKWITVAACYRSKGNVEAALAVMNAMIEAIQETGADASQLKPVMLMLSSCHLDMAKRLRAQGEGETAESKYHFDEGCAGLRGVYGPFVPLPSVANTTTEVNHPLYPSPAGGKERPCTPTATSSTSTRDRSPASRYAQVKMLEREIQSLRDRHLDQADALDRARGTKRKLEADLESEWRARRKLERKLEQLEQDASGAQKGERFALEQCRAEVDARRTAEVRAAAMQQEAADVRAELEPKIAEAGEWERKSKEFFGKLGIVFLKAARGELGDVPMSRAGW
ncbi:hypothetical protein BV20DRAFT_1027743 [Pilatotrama ljubarskyi]|nr:hypothetical protein BV20DRAFT_1027743 [Pilatotrama ljubarskyi]